MTKEEKEYLYSHLIKKYKKTQNKKWLHKVNLYVTMYLSKEITYIKKGDI